MTPGGATWETGRAFSCAGCELPMFPPIGTQHEQVSVGVSEYARCHMYGGRGVRWPDTRGLQHDLLWCCARSGGVGSHRIGVLTLSRCLGSRARMLWALTIRRP